MIIELYRFTSGDAVWNFTSSDVGEIEFEGEVYTSTTLGRGAIESKNQINRENIELTFALDNVMARKFMQFNPDAVTMLTIYGMTDTLTQVVWSGKLAAIKPDGAQIKLTFDSVYTSLKRTGLRARYQRACRHTLYSSSCGVDKALFETDGVATSSSRYTVEISAASSKPDGYFLGGILEDEYGGAAFIVNHLGSTLTLMDRPYSIIEGLKIKPNGVQVKLYPGCSLSRDVCDLKFDNLLNFGGFPMIPDRNPFDGSSIV